MNEPLSYATRLDNAMRNVSEALGISRKADREFQRAMEACAEAEADKQTAIKEFLTLANETHP